MRFKSVVRSLAGVAIVGGSVLVGVASASAHQPSEVFTCADGGTISGIQYGAGGTYTLTFGGITKSGAIGGDGSFSTHVANPNKTISQSYSYSIVEPTHTPGWTISGSGTVPACADVIPTTTLPSGPTTTGVCVPPNVTFEDGSCGTPYPDVTTTVPADVTTTTQLDCAPGGGVTVINGDGSQGCSYPAPSTTVIDHPLDCSPNGVPVIFQDGSQGCSYPAEVVAPSTTAPLVAQDVGAVPTTMVLAAPTGSSTLPATGGDVGWQLAVAGIVVVVGLGLLVASRRRFAGRS